MDIKDSVSDVYSGTSTASSGVPIVEGLYHLWLASMTGSYARYSFGVTAMKTPRRLSRYRVENICWLD